MAGPFCEGRREWCRRPAATAPVCARVHPTGCIRSRLAGKVRPLSMLGSLPACVVMCPVQRLCWPACRWIGEAAWPPEHNTTQLLHLSGCQLLLDHDAKVAASAGVNTRTIGYSPFCGQFEGAWLSFGAPDLPLDQRLEDGNWLTWESLPLTEDMDVVGRPVVVLRLSADQAQATVSARLCAVNPHTLSSLFLSRGCLNLCHRDGHKPSDIKPVVPGEVMTVTVELNMTAFTVPAGYRLRLAVSPLEWPMVWPSPAPVTLTVACTGDSVLALPVRSRTASAEALDADATPLPTPEFGTPLAVDVLRSDTFTRKAEFDLCTGAVTRRIVADDGAVVFPGGACVVHGLPAARTCWSVNSQPVSSLMQASSMMNTAKKSTCWVHIRCLRKLASESASS